MKNSSTFLSIGQALAISFLASAIASQAQTLVTNWTTVQGTYVTGTNTANPVFGNGSGNSAAGSEIYANVGAHVLDVGGYITFSGSFTMTGGSSSANNQFRIGMMYSNGSSNDLGMLGYWFGNSDASNVGYLAERNSPATANDMMSTTGASVPSYATAGAVAFTSTGVYTYSLSYQRASASSLLITWSLSNGGTYVLSKSFTDTSVVSGYNFDTVALFAGTLNASRVSFSDVVVTSSVPEPQVWCLLGFAGFAVILGCKKFRRA